MHSKGHLQDYASAFGVRDFDGFREHGVFRRFRQYACTIFLPLRGWIKQVRDDIIKWTVDSGATVHCTNNRDIIKHVYPDATIDLIVADNRTIKINVIGDAVVKFASDDGSVHDIVLHNVCYHPNLSNLLSVKQLRRDNFRFVFDDSNYFQCKATCRKFPFRLTNKYGIQTAFSAVLSNALLHSRFGHASPRRLKKLSTRCREFPSTNFTSFFDHDPKTCPGIHCKRRASVSPRMDPFSIKLGPLSLLS